MTSENKFKAPDHVTVTDHESESLVHRPSPGAPNSSGCHHLHAGSGYSLRSREATHYRLEFSYGGVVRVLDSISDPVYAPLLLELIVPLSS